MAGESPPNWAYLSPEQIKSRGLDPNPTPELTAEGNCACGRPGVHCCPAWKLQDAKARQAAFEQAAEKLESESKRFATGSVRRLDYKRAADVVRALAKEKPDGNNS